MDYLQQLITRYPLLAGIEDAVYRAFEILRDAYKGGGKLLVAGNGGSAADAEHIVGELLKGFVKRRPIPKEFELKLRAAAGEDAEQLINHLQGGLPAIALPGSTALLTAALNDMDSAMVYAQQVYGYAREGDVFLGISTSGRAKNITAAMITARAMGLKTIALTGGSGGALPAYADVLMLAPETETYKVQELHLPIYHTLCLMLEDYFF
jgi:D-sedoheptulose 7-phosphate isomerase